MKRSEVQAEAWRLKDAGVKWRHRQRDAHATDCIGFIQLIADHFGVPYVDVEGYSRMPHGEDFVDHIKKFTIPAAPPLKPGMIVILRDEHLPCHVGVLVERYGQLRIVHCSLQARKVVEEIWDRSFTSKFRLAVDFPGIEEG